MTFSEPGKRSATVYGIAFFSVTVCLEREGRVRKEGNWDEKRRVVPSKESGG